MKKWNFVLVFCMALAVLLSVGAVSLAQPPFNSQCSAICTSIGDLGLGHGQCVSFCTTCTSPGVGAGVNLVCFCNSIEFATGGAISFAECVQIVTGA